MPTVRALLADAIPRLRQAGCDSPRLDAELLLAHALGLPRIRLRVHPEQAVSAEQAARFRALLARRVRREPIAYLLGEWEFYGRPFLVSPAVLVPRPETEMLAEAVLRWAREAGARRLADIGTGSGILAVTLALELPAAMVYAVDLSADALRIARANAERHGVGARVTVLQGDLLAPLMAIGALELDALVANLPYIADAQMADLMPEVGVYEPELALRGGENGLALITRLIAESPEVLRPGGLLALEVGDGQAEAVRAELAARGWREIRVIEDYGGRARDVLAVRAGGA
ncbi:MAG TPA: peptide chain release factor N(5)-glutamine methyltransferase [Armatimonadota bacterium]|nr:peptide chain release factor N(5)-glutamine methyltransferase [Armatimonadota bacterium]